MHGGWTDEAGVIGKQRAGKPADRAGDDETGQSVAKGREADCPHAPIVRAGALQHHAEARVHQMPGDVNGRNQQQKAQVIELRPVGEIDRTRKGASLADAQPVVGAVAIEPYAEIVDELREGERDHDEIDAASAQRQCPHDKGKQRAGNDRERPLHEPGRYAFEGQDAHRITADSEIDGMPEADHAAVAENEVEAGRRHRQDQNAGKERHQEGVPGERRIERQRREEQQQDDDHRVARHEKMIHLPDAGNRPSGRSTSTIAISK